MNTSFKYIFLLIGIMSGGLALAGDCNTSCGERDPNSRCIVYGEDHKLCDGWSKDSEQDSQSDDPLP